MVDKKLLLKQCLFLLLGVSVILPSLICPWVIYSLVYYPVIQLYQYCSDDGGYNEVEIPVKGRGYSHILHTFQQYQQSHPQAILMIKDDRQWGNIFAYWDNITHPRWQLPKGCQSRQP